MSIKWMITKSDYNEIRKSVNKDADNRKLEALKKEVIAILEKKDSQELKKAIEYFEQDELRYSHLEKSITGEWIEKAGYGVGTVRIWKGKKYKKVSSTPTRWVRVFDKNDRGASTSMGRYIAQVKKCESVEELYQFCMKQRSLFQDENGNDLPIMDKLRSAIDSQSNKIENEKNNATKTNEYMKEDLANLKAGNYSFGSFEDFKAEINKQAGDKRGAKQPNYIGYLKISNDDYLKKVYDAMPKAEKNNDVNSPEFKKQFKESYQQALKDVKNLSDAKLKKELNHWEDAVEQHKDSPALASYMGKVQAFSEELADRVNAKAREGRKPVAQSYWMVDKNGRRINNNDAMQIMRNNWEEIDRLANSDEPRKEMKIRDLKNYNDDIMDKLIPEERKEMESESEKHQNRSDAMKGNKNAYKGGFEDTPISKAVEKYASDKQIKSTVDKVNSDDIASTDPIRMFMMGTFHEDGYEIATDGHVLSMIKSDYPTDDEGKIKATPKAIKEIDKTLKTLNKKLTDSESELKAVENKVGRGSYNYQIVSKRIEDLKEDIANAEKSKETGIINGFFPNYKKVIPSVAGNDIEPASGFEDFNKILKVAKVAAAYNKAKKENASVKVGDYNFDPNLLINAVAMAEKHGLKNVNFRPNSYNPAQSPIEFSGDNGYVVIMPMGNDSGRTTFDATTGDVSGKSNDNIKDFLSGDKKSDVKKALFDLISMIDDSEDEEFEPDFEDESYSDYDASQPDLFNSISYKVGAALDSIFGC